MTDIKKDETRYIRDDYPYGPVTYRYYTIGASHPVRAIISPRGGRIGQEAPDREAGRLVFKALDLTLMTSPDVEEIDRETFERMCMELDSLDVSRTYGKLAPSQP